MALRISIFAFILGIIGASCVALAFYRLYLHPLARLPGPWPNKLSGWPHGMITQSGRRHLWLHGQHIRYGPVVRITPNRVSINTATALKEIYGSRKAPLTRGQFYDAVKTAEGGYTTFTAPNEKLHGPKRRLLSHAFSEKAVQDSEQYVSKNVNIWLDQLGAGPVSDDGWTKPTNVATWINYLAFDILTDLAFGRSFGLLTKNDMRFVADLIPATAEGAYLIGQHPITGFMKWFAYKTSIGAWLAGPIVQAIERLKETSSKLIAERRSLESSTNSATPPRKDIFHHLFRGKDPETGQAYTDKELLAESILLLVAGSDTSATTIAASIFYLLRHPSVLQNLRKELHQSFGDLNEINYAGTQLANLPYLRACIDEALRLNPPVSSVLGRMVMEPGINVDGVYYPPGIEIGVAPFALHHNAEYFPDPYTFRPERWIVDDQAGFTKEVVQRQHSAFCAFSIGPRNCIGKNLAYVELSLALARCVWKYDMEEVAGWNETLGGNHVSSTGEYLTRDDFVSKKDGPLVRFRERKI